jgi:superfamily I DNA/RNA helicase
MVEGKFPSDKEDFDPIVHESREQAASQKKAQERMLAYVAVTRGKKSVTVQSYGQTGGGKDAGAV